MGYTLHISPKEIHKHAQTILTPITFGENGIVLCYPGCFIGYTIHAFMDSPAILKKYLGSYYQKYVLIPVELTAADTIESVEARTIQYIRETTDRVLLPQSNTLAGITRELVSKGLDPYFFLIDTQTVPLPKLKGILQLFHTIVTIIPKAGTLIFSEANLYAEEWADFIHTYHRFQHTRAILPVFSETESRQFVKTLAHVWRMRLTEQAARMIVRTCGGYLWLLREAVRSIRDGNTHSRDAILTKSRIVERAEYIFRRFDERTVNGMMELCTNPSPSLPQDIRSYLIDTGVVVPRGELFIPSCPIFSDLLTKHAIRRQLHAADGKILFGDIRIDQMLSVTEQRVLARLIKDRGSVVSREDLAAILWGNQSDTKYSDWAIDKTISRLRKVLSAIGLSATTIVTKKKRGFLIV